MGGNQQQQFFFLNASSSWRTRHNSLLSDMIDNHWGSTCRSFLSDGGIFARLEIVVLFYACTLAQMTCKHESYIDRSATSSVVNIEINQHMSLHLLVCVIECVLWIAWCVWDSSGLGMKLRFLLVSNYSQIIKMKISITPAWCVPACFVSPRVPSLLFLFTPRVHCTVSLLITMISCSLFPISPQLLPPCGLDGPFLFFVLFSSFPLPATVHNLSLGHALP